MFRPDGEGDRLVFPQVVHGFDGKLWIIGVICQQNRVVIHSLSTEKVNTAKKAGDLGGARPFVEVAGAAELGQFAIKHQGDVITKDDRFFLIMGDENNGYVKFLLN